MRGTSDGSGKPARAAVAAGAVVVAVLGTGAAGCSAGAPATLPQASCGTVTTHSLSAATQVLDTGKSALDCFQTAARHCRAASLGITEMGADTGTNHVFTIQPGGTGCPVSELSQSYSANFGGSNGTITVTQCHLGKVTGAGVMLTCAGQDVLIPEAVTRF